MKTCRKCSTEMKESTGNFTHTIFGLSVVVEEVPYVTCETCDKIEYISSRDVDFLIRDAYRANVNSVRYPG